MRVMVVSVPAVGHFHPLVPLALALAEAGDEVLVAAAPSLGARAEALGFASAAVGTEVDDWFARLGARVRGVPGQGLAPERILPFFIPRLFGEVGAPMMADDLVPLVASWRPDLVVYESYAFAAPLAAAVAGVPAVHLPVLLLPPMTLWELCADALSSLWSSFGVAPAPLGGLFDGLTLSPWPASLDTADGYGPFRIERIRPVPHDAAVGDGLPGWVADLPVRPTVYMTLGTVTNTDVSVFRAVLDGLADEAVNLVVTVGRDNDPAALGPVPGNARVERYIPQSLLLPSCSAVISHGGTGTTLACLGHGLPHLVIPQGADQFVNAQRCVDAGLGRQLLPGEVTADAVRKQVALLLSDDADARRRVADEIAATPGPDAWVGRLRTLAGDASPPSGEPGLGDPGGGVGE